MNIIEKLKTFNVEITAEMEKAFAGEFVSEKEMEKKLSKLQTENEALKEKAETAEETLKGFEGKNFDEITCLVLKFLKYTIQSRISRKMDGLRRSG